MNAGVITIAIIVSIMVLNTSILTGLAVFAVLQIRRELIAKRQLNEIVGFSAIYANQESIDKILDEFIENSIQRYISFNPTLFDDYITEKNQEKIIAEVMSIILHTISPTLITQLRLIYNKDSIEQILLDRVTLSVISISIGMNNDVK